MLPDLFLREKKVGFYPAGEFEEFTLQSWCHPQLAAATLSCLLPLLPEKASPCGSWLDCRDSLGSEISGVLHFAETPLGRDQTIPEENSGREVDTGDLLHHLFPTPPSLFLALLQDSSHRGFFSPVHVASLANPSWEQWCALSRLFQELVAGAGLGSAWRGSGQ